LKGWPLSQHPDWAHNDWLHHLIPCAGFPPMADALITDKGIVDRPRGWYDAQW
jgi:hypothetical protein